MSTGIGVAGFPGAGKTTAGEMISDEIGGRFVEISDIVKEVAMDELGDDAGKNDISKWVDEGMKTKGDDFVSRLVRDYLSDVNDEFVVISGVRRPSDVEMASEGFDDFVVVFVDADFDVRFRRITEERGDEEFDREMMRERDEREEDWGITEVQKHYADYFIDNNSNLSALESEVERVVEDIL